MKNIILRLSVLAFAMIFSACDSESTTLRLVAPSSDLDLEIAHILADTLDENSHFRLEISSEQQTGNAALDMLLAGDADMALVSNYLPYREGVMTVLPLYPSVLHIMYHDGKDSSSAFSLMNQANVYAGLDGSASRLIFERIAERSGVSKGNYSFVQQDGDLNIVDPELIVVFAPISPQRVAEFKNHRLYSLGAPADIGSGSIVDAATLLNPPLRPFVIPAGTYSAANIEPVVAVAVDKMLVVRSDIAASVIYDLIEEVLRSRPALSAARPGLFNGLHDRFDVSKSTFVLHAGTQDYLQREEPTIYERYSGVAEVVVTLAIALITAVIAVIKIIKIQRKNRIDEFYSAAIEIRDSVSATPSTKEKAVAAEKIRQLQNKAFEQLVDEKLSADESFRIFITLSNDILEQTEKK